MQQHTQRRNHLRTLSIVLGCSVFIVAGFVASFASSFANTRFTAPPPSLIPPDSDVSYTSLSPSDSVTSSRNIISSQPLAELDTNSDSTYKSVEVYQIDPATLQNKETDSASIESYQILSSVRYTFNDFKLLVTLTKPSAAAIQENRILGDTQFQLVDGSVAWLSIGTGGNFPTRVVFSKNDLLVTVASDTDLAPEHIQRLASQVVVREAK